MSDIKPVYVVELKPGRWLDDCGEAVDAIDRARMFPSRRSAGVACRSALNLWPGASVATPTGVAHAADEPVTPEPTAEFKPFFVVELQSGRAWLGDEGLAVGTPVLWATFASRRLANDALIDARTGDNLDFPHLPSEKWPDARIVEHDSDPEAEPDESEATEQPEQPEPASPTALELALRQVAALKAQFSDALDVTVVQAGTIDALRDMNAGLRECADAIAKDLELLRKIIKTQADIIAQQARQIAKLCKVRR